jgi:hypothetical protein
VQTTRLWTLSQFGTTVSTVAVVAFDAAIPISEAAALASCKSRSRKAASTQALATANATSILAAQPHRSGPVSVCKNGPHRMHAGAAGNALCLAYARLLCKSDSARCAAQRPWGRTVPRVGYTSTRCSCCACGDAQPYVRRT